MKETSGIVKTKTNEEEIDLAEVFSLFGSVVGKLVASIKKLSNLLFFIFVKSLFFFRNNVIIIFASTLIGGVIGGVYNYNYSVPTYLSTMLVEPNFGSSSQLYQDVEFYKGLISDGNIDKLATSLSITKEDASNIVNIEIEPKTDANTTLQQYARFVSTLDSTGTSMITFEQYVEDRPQEAFDIQKIIVTSRDKYIFEKLQNPIINRVTNNPYFLKKRKLTEKQLHLEEKAILFSLSQLDTLKNLYHTTMIAESRKVNSGININMGSKTESNKEIVVFEKHIELNKMLVGVYGALAKREKVVDVVNGFGSVGVKIGGLRKNGLIMGVLLSFVLSSLVLILWSLDKWLKQYYLSNIEGKSKK